MALKESKAETEWKVLEGAAKKATAPTGAAFWNTDKRRSVNDVLFGVVGETREVMTRFGKGMALEIAPPKGATVSVFLSAVLSNQIAAAGGFDKGDRVFIKFLGKPKGKRYNVYAVGKNGKA